MDAPAQVCAILLGRGAGAVVVTLSERGCAYAGRNGTADAAAAGAASCRPPDSPDFDYVSLPAMPLGDRPVVDTTGAGDAFVGSLAHYLAHRHASGLSTVECVRRAGAVASLSVLRPGTQMSYPYRDELPSSLRD